MPVTIRVSTTTAKVQAQPVQAVTITPTDGARVLVVPTPGPPGPPGDAEAISQVIATGTAAAALSGHRAVTRRTDGAFEYASNTDPAHLSAPIWVTTGAASSGAEVTAVAFGPLDEPSWSWTVGPVFLGVNGALTQTPPTAPGAVFLAQIGTATAPTSIFVDRQHSITLA
ncbi:hypothetical protein [Nocardia asiatica]|uniref:hypothetical protein n=1 Tax=Nocardia asiatica TaxID=209252 RepID=UPI00245585D7|nr:hypothetical protein [Nocardia asiatica]